MGSKNKKASALHRDDRWNVESKLGIDVSKNESKAAAYLGFATVGELRQYQASHTCMEAYFHFDAVRPRKGGLKGEGIFRQLEEAKDELLRTFGRTWAELDQKCPVTRSPGETPTQAKLKVDKHMAGVLYQLVHHQPAWSDNEQRTMAQQHFVNRPDEKSLPPITTAPPTPTWGPLQGEAWGEPFNRALGLLRITMTAFNRWDERLGKASNLESTTMDPNERPSFMRGADDVDEGPPAVVREPVDMLSKKLLGLRWNDPRPRRETLETTYGKTPSMLQTAPDIRAYPAAEWRDQVRVLYEFERLRLNFESITMWFRDESGEDEDRDLLEGDWHAIQEIVNRLDENAFEAIRFRTRDMEEGEIIIEYRGIPTVLASYLTAKDGAVSATADATKRVALLERGGADTEKESAYHKESSPDRDSEMGMARIGNPV